VTPYSPIFASISGEPDASIRVELFCGFPQTIHGNAWIITRIKETIVIQYGFFTVCYQLLKALLIKWSNPYMEKKMIPHCSMLNTLLYMEAAGSWEALTLLDTDNRWQPMPASGYSAPPYLQLRTYL
jgi:hypothetical protein